MSNATEFEQIAERGSLTLHHCEGDEKNPETYLVKHRDNPDLTASLEVARDFFELSDRYGTLVRLNGSQAVTVKTWSDEYL